MNALLLYAAMLLGMMPEGWTLYYEQSRGLDAYVYERGDERILAIQGTKTMGDLVAIPVRRLFGYSDRYLKIARVLDVDLVIGHSAGGGMASWVAYELGVPSVTFNAAAPTEQALLNDGAQQTNVVVTGDRWGDPANTQASLAGTYVYLPPAPEGVRSHPMTTVFEILGN
jgi:hypothetical protein